MQGDTVECPWHGSRFCISTGRIRRGPATFTVREREGVVEVRQVRGLD